MKSLGGINSPEHHPRLNFAKWTRANLPNFGYYMTDADLFVRTNLHCAILLEVKCKGKTMSKCQEISYKVMDKALNELHGKTFEVEGITISNFKFFGSHALVFEETCFHDGKAYLNGEEITEAEAISFLSFGDYCSDCVPNGQCPE